jgi:hypothetical protein
MEWPYRRFFKAFDAFQRRVLCDEWRTRKTTHIAAMFANTNFDDEKNDRPTKITQLEEQYNQIITRIWNGSSEDEMSEAEQEAWESPFMKAGRKAIQSGVESFAMPGESALEALPQG